MPYAVTKKRIHSPGNSTSWSVGYTRTRVGAVWLLFWDRLLARYDPKVVWHIESVTD